MHFLKKYSVLICLSISCILGILSIILVKLDPEFENIWLPFWLHVASFLGVCLVFVLRILPKKNVIHHMRWQDVFSLSVVALVAMSLSFVMLIRYPYVSVGDEVRDGGLNALQIANGLLPNIFNYGAYAAHGLIIPTIASFFYKFFASSVLTYRLPAALISTADIVILFFLLRRITNNVIGMLGAGSLAVSPFHLFFARTQIVVAFNSFWTTVILCGAYYLLETDGLVNYIFLGSVLGFASQFHAGVRVVALLVGIVIIFLKFVALLQHKVSVVRVISGLGLMLLFGVVSFGPQILFTNTQTFFHTGRFIYQSDFQRMQIPPIQQLMQIGQNYMISLAAWIYQPVTFFFHDGQPLIPFLLVPLVLLGMLYSTTLVRKAFLYLLFALALLVPFFSSAITDAVNADHRLDTLLPIGAIFCSIGIYVVLRFIKNTSLQRIFLGAVGLYLIFLGLNFFVSRAADKGWNVHDYMLMNAIYLIEDQIAHNNPDVAQSYCLLLSPQNFQTSSYLHYQEQEEYFLPNVSLQKRSDRSIQDNEIYVFKDTCPFFKDAATKEIIHECTGSIDYFCPVDYKGELREYFN